jgi:hypothetical protein
VPDKEDTSSSAMAAALAVKAQKWIQLAVTNAFNPTPNAEATPNPTPPPPNPTSNYNHNTNFNPDPNIKAGHVDDVAQTPTATSEVEEELEKQKLKEKEVMRIEAAEAVLEIEATLNAFSKEAFAFFAKYLAGKMKS